MPQTVSTQDALVYAMVTVSAVDGHMADPELMTIGNLTRVLPVFSGFDSDRLPDVSRTAAEILAGSDGLENMLSLLEDAVPEKLYDTLYAMVVEVAVADLDLPQEELRFLSLLRDRLAIDKLTAAALERSATARYRRV
ncbi:tellurite resistance TerB family protein [Afifella marina]|uniref:Tellurite resistance protein TerB n=1 Tax=Afifella marina DSM 2698 TaxID=1120955 RepID=A0A1G5M4G4_AFIMA|nr:tellurite resistance TerB family protein [Afifella marina]MBK1623035.1 Tellurite resistance protein TerB [Afifella marina DSM 2698]MBK1626029.1 Tellurite resistance protein TerB [Afifella marina]MBK5917853.1 Tellurite resistance protein TerB [Afifella marina]RAI18209.1 Tellurite resistance protein TerB [Afifella marina DSM 2698]SCZ19704.1 Tellurite resistance protein TerB [Afifella marina DSM 2698]